MSKRWRPPPMNQEPAASGEAPSKKITVDEGVVRKMLQVNPDMRDGRTTFQVKQDMEAGQAVSTAPRRNTGEVAAATPAASGGTKNELDDTLAFFMKGKAQELDAKLADLVARRRALEEEEKAVRAALVSDLSKFLGLLDPKVVALHGVAALSKHKAVLERAGITPAQVLEASRKKG